MKICIDCNKETNYFITKRCRTCYRKKLRLEWIKSEHVICTGCQESVPVKLLDNKKKKICHKCYVKEKRQIIIQEAINNPIKRQELKEKYRREYLKSKAKGHYKTLYRRHCSMLNRIKQADPETDINIQWYYENIFQKNCHYCGVTEELAKKITKNSLHIDRLDPNKGYKQSNCVPACKACNTAKLNLWTPEETKELGKLIKLFYEKRNY